ncbi:MAG: hypothetical protein FWC70_09465 [Defluviitaleaceae bacterium]|nr:hypothetical protein [Defluviitaleaceae bacterium]
MSGAKIFVLHKKDLVKIGAIAIGAIVLLVVLLVLLLSGGRGEYEPESRFIPGTYSSMILLNDEPLHVRVTVSENEILSVFLSDMTEQHRVFYPLFEPRMEDLALEVLRYQSAFITPQTDYPVTTGILQHAVISALEMAHVPCCCDGAE